MRRFCGWAKDIIHIKRIFPGRPFLISVRWNFWVFILVFGVILKLFLLYSLEKFIFIFLEKIHLLLTNLFLAFNLISCNVKLFDFIIWFDINFVILFNAIIEGSVKLFSVD